MTIPPTLHITFKPSPCGGTLIDKTSPEPFVGSVEYVRVFRGYMCVVDGIDDPEDSCVITTRDYQNCFFAKPGMKPCDCQYWQSIPIPPPRA